MTSPIDEIVAKIETLQQELERELDARRETLERQALAHQRELKKNLAKFWSESGVLNFVSAPIIYALVVPLALLDVSLSIYQFLCFPIYGIKRVPRSDFVVIDRHHLAYLNAVEKLNCTYCGYANGVIAFGREIASRTEQRWCPIKHAGRVAGVHPRYWQFDDFGDAEAFRRRPEHKG